MKITSTTAHINKPIQHLSVANDVIAIACGSLTYDLWDGELTMISVENKMESLLFKGGLSSIIKIPSGNYIASSFDGSLHTIYKTNNKLEEIQIAAHDTPILTTCYSYTTNQLLSSSLDGQIKLWNLDQDRPKQIFEFYQQRRAATGISWRPNEKQFLSVGGDATIKLWDSNTPKYSLSCNQKYSSLSVDWSTHDNNYFLTGREDGYVQLFDIRKLDLSLCEVQFHNDAIWAMSSSGNYFATGSDDGTAKVIELTEDNTL